VAYFVSYRRQESKDFAGRLSDRLAGRFGVGQVFIDVDTIEPGVDFAEEISRAVAACKVLVAVIGPTWLTVADERGRRRLDDPDDIVRLEIEAALARHVRVIPILVEGAVMPDRRDLPESLADLTRRNALIMRHESFHSDAGRLVTVIEGVLAAAPGATEMPSTHAYPDARSAGNPVGEVAQKGPGRARNDLARAARLLTDAEHIAYSITDEHSKASALSEVAEALAATDPDRAERIAHSITDEHSKASALREVAKTLAATDPDRAARLLTDAERIADSITDEHWKALALSEVAEALAATDPDRAERIADSITDEHWKASALREVAEALAATDPDRAARLLTDAERIANTITEENTKVWALSDIAEALAATNPDRAERIAYSITDEHSKAPALSEVAKALAATDPGRAALIFTDAERIAYSITDEHWKASVLGEVAEALAATDPDRAERIAHSITDESWEASVLSDVAKALIVTSS
jgi:predicted SnoaL-like aldol condensation-catalyzing enzyme